MTGALLDTFWQQLTSQSLLEVLAVICSLCYVHFAARQHRACWPFALVSTSLFIYLFWETSLFFNSILNGWYLIMAVYGWFNWKNMEEEHKPVTSWGLINNILLIVGLTIVSLVCYKAISSMVSEEILLLDLSVSVFSAVITYMLAQKVRENWLYWIVINALTSFLCFQQGLILVGVLHIIYMAYSIKGFVNWGSETEQPVEAQKTASE